MSNQDKIMQLLKRAKLLAREYYKLTGKPLGVTGEIAEYEAARLLGLELTEARTAGFDAIERGNGRPSRRLQIKGRCIPSAAKPGQRLGRIDVNKEWDAVLLVLMDMDYEVTAIYEAEREAVVAAIMRPGSKSRNERGALAVSSFRAIGTKRWPADG